MIEQNTKEKSIKYIEKNNPTVAEFKAYLEKINLENNDLTEIMNYVNSLGLVDDNNYSENYILMAIDKNQGPHRISEFLKAKGVDEHIIKIALEKNYPNSVIDSVFSEAVINETKKMIIKIEQVMLNEYADINSVDESLYSKVALTESWIKSLEEPTRSKTLKKITSRLMYLGFSEEKVVNWAEKFNDF